MRSLLPVFSVLVACGPQASDIQVLPGMGDHQPAGKIYGGSAPDPDSVEHDSVVSLHQLAKGGSSVYVQPFCTGTLIEPDVVLTAAHCLDTGNSWRNFRTMDPGDLAIYVGDDPAAQDSSGIVYHLYAVSETQINSSYDKNQLYNDIAIIRLSTSVSEVGTIANLPSSEGLTSSDVGATVNFAGFGEDENGNSGVKLQADHTIGGLGCSVSGCPSSGDNATQVSYSQTSGVGPCFGDSGGPMFIYRSSGTYVAGVTSYGDSNCAVYGVSTRVDAYESWISDFVGGGGTGGGTGGDSGGSDGGGTGGDTCGDGTCDVGESCDGRDGTIDCPSDCDGKTNGKPTGRYCVVDGVCEGSGCP